MEALKNFRIRSNSPRDKTPGTLGAPPPAQAGGNNNPPPPIPPRITSNASESDDDDDDESIASDNNDNDEYLAYFEKARRVLGKDTKKNRFMAMTMTDGEMLRRKLTALAKDSDKPATMAKRPVRKAPRNFDGEIKSDFTSWKREVESYFRYYSHEFRRESDRISWIEGILKDKALRWHQARQNLADLRVRDNWSEYWQAADTQFRNEHEIVDASRKLRELRYKGDISDYLVSLRDLNRKRRIRRPGIQGPSAVPDPRRT